jgi:hypothetical protein
LPPRPVVSERPALTAPDDFALHDPATVRGIVRSAAADVTFADGSTQEGTLDDAGSAYRLAFASSSFLALALTS